MADNGDLHTEMTHIQSGWTNWKRVSGILCARRISLRVNGKVYIQDGCKTTTAMMYGPETWAVKKPGVEVGCGGNEDVKMDECSHQAGQN